MFRKLRGIGRRDSEPAPSAPPATTAESEPVNPSPRAIHISDVRRSPTEQPRRRGYDIQPVSLFVANAKGAVGAVDLYRVRIYLPRAAQHAHAHAMLSFN
jgi:hypothetical protein